MTADELISEFKIMVNEHWQYTWGAAEKGCVDCSGAFVYSFRRHNQSIYHGSNTIARKYVTGDLITDPHKVVSGMIAFKTRKPGDTKYNLPDKYKSQGDQLDYYHCGLVVGNRVYNAQSAATGFVSSSLDGWSHFAYLKGVDYSEPVPKPTSAGPAYVYADTGKTVNLRKLPSKSSAVLERIPIGSAVEITDDLDWTLVKYNDKVGWIQTIYLKGGE